MRAPAGPPSLADALDFDLPPELEADGPAEERGGRRDDVRMLVAHRMTGALEHRRFDELADVLRPGDVVVINTSRTVAAALAVRAPGGEPLELHLSVPVPGTDLWTVELRRPSGPASVAFAGGAPGWRLTIVGGGVADLVGRAHEDGRLWLARLQLPAPLEDHLDRHGYPIRYGYVRRPWPLSAYQNVYATEPGSAELPSAGRAFTPELITRLVASGVEVAPLVLHTGVASLESHEPPYPERFVVPEPTARRINSARAACHRIVAVGTTVVRALETVAGEDGSVHPGEGWTDVIITPERGVRAIDGLLTGWHEPRASHLAMLEAVAGRSLLSASYDEALAEGYRWHEFGDLHLIVP